MGMDQKYDTNAIKVVNSNKKQIGHIKGTTAATTSKTWDSQNAALKSKGECILAMGTILDSGNEYEQSVMVVFKKVQLLCDQAAKVATMDAPATNGVGTPKVAKRAGAAVPVTVSSKKAKRL